MDERALFTGFWENESKTTRKVIARIPEGSDYRPDPKSRTASAIAWQIACEEKMIIEALETGKAEWKPPPAPATMKELLDIYEKQSVDIVRRKNPPHPGAFIRTEILEPHRLSVTAAAEVLGVSRPTLSNLLNGQADLSGDMALRVEKAFGGRMDTLMRMQMSYDIARTREREKSITVRRYRRGRAA